MSKVELLLEPIEPGGAHVAVTISDAKGNFALVDLDPGGYRLKGKRNGFLEMSYGARRPGSDGSVVRLEKGQSLDGLKFKLTPAAVVAGRVRDSDGEPLEGALVTLARLAYADEKPRIESLDSTETDDRGEYRFRGLPAAKYYVGVEPKSHGWDRVDHSAYTGPKEMSVPTLYPGSTDAATAAPITVPSGAHVDGIDITLVRTRVFRVSGRVQNAPAGTQMSVILHDPKSASMRSYDMRTPIRNSAGDFEFRDVPPGLYEISVRDQSLQARTSIIVAPADVENVRMALAPGPDVKLQINTDGPDKPDLSQLDYFLTVDGRTGFVPQFQRERFICRNVPPGHYALKLSGALLRKYYVKEVRAGDVDVLTDGLTVQGSGLVEVEIVIASDGAVVEGLVRDDQQQPVSGATVLLAPDQRSRMDLYKSTNTDQNGRYEFTAAAPGAFKLFAFEDVASDAWNDPEFLNEYEKRGARVVLEPKSHHTVALALANRQN